MALSTLRCCRRLLVGRARTPLIFPKCPCPRPSEGNFVINPTLRRFSTTTEPAAAGEKPPFDKFFVHGSTVNPVFIERAELEKHQQIHQHQQQQRLREEEESAVAVEKEEEVSGGRGVNLGKSEGKSELEQEAWRLLNKAVVTYCGSPVGTVAADDPSAANEKLNYDQVFIRDFVPSAIAFLLKGESEIVRNFLLHTLQLQVEKFSSLSSFFSFFLNLVEF